MVEFYNTTTRGIQQSKLSCAQKKKKTKQALTKHYMINQNSRTTTALSHHIETKHQGKKRLCHIDTNITRKSKLLDSRKQRTLSYHTEPKIQDKKRLSQTDTNRTHY